LTDNRIEFSLAFFSGDYHLACPTIYLADKFAEENIHVYFYHFTLRSSVSPWHEWMGVLHGKTNTETFNNLFLLLLFFNVNRR